MKHFQKVMISLLVLFFITGLFIGQSYEADKHEHVEGKVYFNDLKHVRHTICLEDTSVFTMGRHHLTEYRIIVEKPEWSNDE